MTSAEPDGAYGDLPEPDDRWRAYRPNVLSNGNDYRWIYRPHDHFNYKCDSYVQDAHPAFTWLGGLGPS